MDTTDRSHLNFGEKVRKMFAFLEDLGFSAIEFLPTLVRYQNSDIDIEVDVYHGRQSYEIGAGITVSGMRYSISEILQANDPEAHKQFRYSMATTSEGVNTALEELSLLMKRYGDAALKGESQFVATIEAQRKKWSENYAMNVLVSQLLPKANDAFRQKDYTTAVDLYSRIRECLSSAELKKLDFANKYMMRGTKFQ